MRKRSAVPPLAAGRASRPASASCWSRLVCAADLAAGGLPGRSARLLRQEVHRDAGRRDCAGDGPSCRVAAAWARLRGRRLRRLASLQSWQQTCACGQRCAAQVRGRHYAGTHGGRLVKLQGSVPAVQAALALCVRALLDGRSDGFADASEWGYEAPQQEVSLGTGRTFLPADPHSTAALLQGTVHYFPLHRLSMWMSRGHFTGAAHTMQLRQPEAGCWAPLQAVLHAHAQPPATEGASCAAAARAAACLPSTSV